MNGLYHVFVIFVCLASPHAVVSIEVGSLNLGHSNPDNASGAFWRMVGNSADAAARHLGVGFETLYPNRNHMQMVKQGKRVLAQYDRPENLIVVNLKRSATPLVQAASGKDARVLLMMHALLPDQRAESSRPRGAIGESIGTLLPDNEYTGYEIAEEIIRSARRQKGADTPVRMGATAGDEATYTAIERAKGLRCHMYASATDTRASARGCA